MWTYIKKDKVDLYLKQYPQLSEDFDNTVLLDTADAFFLPRLFAKNYPSEHLTIFTGKQESYVPSTIENIKFTGSLREKQLPLVNTFLKIYKENGYVNGIAKSHPGSGKTVMSVYLATQLKVKTLIIVDNQNLMKQWVKAIIDFTNLTVDDIGIIQQKHFGIEKPIIIAMGQTLQSLLKKGIQEAFKLVDKGVGLVIYDEVHTTSAAPVFSKISLLFRTRNIIGLSATPFHTGLQEVLMNNTIGDVIYETKNYDMKPEYRLLFYKSALDNKKIYVISKMTDYLHRKAMYNKLIIGSENYKNLILDQTRKRRAEGHRIIIVCFTKIQVTTISEMLTNNGLTNTRFYGEEREIDFTENILVVTYSFCGKGFDFPALSCLILACPLAGKKSMIQVIGRILRSSIDKLKPLVLDLADMTVPMFTIPEVRMKKKIITEEFVCDIVEENIT